MLKRVNRLRKRYQFNYIYKSGTRFPGKTVVLFVSPSKTKAIKVGFAVSKKIGSAVTRNKVRRRLREVVFSEILSLKQNYNIIVMARDNILDFSFLDIAADFDKLAIKAGLKNEKSI